MFIKQGNLNRFCDIFHAINVFVDGDWFDVYLT